MCGIVGYVGKRQALPILLKGLEALEYRGYDSAGIACLEEKTERLQVVKEKGKLIALKEKLKGSVIRGCAGIGHTRWATHGEPSQRNAHPHFDASGRIALVHNGIIENYSDLKKELSGCGIRFHSETDSEAAVQLIAYYLEKLPLQQAFVKAIKRLRGYFSFVLMDSKTPGCLYVFRRSNPLCIGVGDEEHFVASDVTPLLPYTRKVIYLEDDEYACITAHKAVVRSLKSGRIISRKPVFINWDVVQAAKEGYPHFMLKEIYEQPAVLRNILKKRLTSKGSVVFDTLSGKSRKRLKSIKKVFMVSCGTAYHAGLIGGILMEDFVRIPALSQVSSEFRYSDPVVGKDDLVVLITQSGETADTLAALREAKEKGAMTLAIVNVVGSTIAREADAVIYTHAGPEIGVASTKAYTAQLMTLVLFAVYTAALRKKRMPEEYARVSREIKRLPEYCEKVLSQYSYIDRSAKKLSRCKNFLFLGRGYNFPSALEGALKLKEISYAHAHGYAAGEMKHGPIALIDSSQPVICAAPNSKTYDKMISNIEEIRARGGIVFSIGTEGSAALKKRSHFFVPIPRISEPLSPLLCAIVLQIFAYKIAVYNKRDVDQPRNLAKSVTVE